MDKEYSGLDGRFSTMKSALGLLLQRANRKRDHDANKPLFNIVETGCQRGEDDWGAGMSTKLFADFCSRYNGYIHSVDIEPANVKLANDATEPFASFRSVECGDSVDWMLKFRERNIVIDFLYLDSWDFPYGEILNEYGGREDIEKAEEIVRKIPYAEIHDKFGPLLLPSQTHCLKELVAAWPMLHAKTIILIDDSDLPGGGKAHQVRKFLAMHGWTCVLDKQQSLWILDA